MVTKDYKCLDCEKVQERAHRITETVKCDCGGELKWIPTQENIGADMYIFSSPYYYNGSFRRHPRKTDMACNDSGKIKIK